MLQPNILKRKLPQDRSEAGEDTTRTKVVAEKLEKSLKFNSLAEFERDFWKKPPKAMLNIHTYQGFIHEYQAMPLAQGGYGSVYTFVVVIDGKKNFFAVKVMKQPQFQIDVDNLNQSLSDFSELMPFATFTDNSGKSVNLAPRFHDFGNQLLCLMGIWRAVNDWQIEHSSKIATQLVCQELLRLAEACNDNHIAVVDYKLGNIGCRSVKNERGELIVTCCLLDLDGLVFLSSCYRYNLQYAVLVHTCVRPRIVVLEAKHFLEHDTDRLETVAAEQLCYLSMALARLHVMQIIIASANPHYFDGKPLFDFARKVVSMANGQKKLEYYTFAPGALFEALETKIQTLRAQIPKHSWGGKLLSAHREPWVRLKYIMASANHTERRTQPFSLLAAFSDTCL